MICPRCNTEIYENEIFCRNCGYELQGAHKNSSAKLLRNKNILIVFVIVGVLIIFSLFAFIGKEPSSNNVYDSPEYYQDMFESCHSTYEHKQAIYSYDIDGDNYLSAYETELFLKAHPRVGNDKQFMQWLETIVE